MMTMRPVFGIDGELDVRAARFHADGADDREAGVAHDLVFLVGQRLDGGDGDGVAGMHAHGIEILDGTDDHTVVGLVPHDLHLEFLPAQQRFLDEDLPHGRQFQTAPGQFLELLAIVRRSAAGPAQGEAGSDDEGKPADPSATARASSNVWAVPLMGTSNPMTA
jgi:hypothetical protein